MGTRDGTEPARVTRRSEPRALDRRRCRRPRGSSSVGDRALGVDPPELVALVRVAVAVEGPRVTRAHELVADDVTLREVVVEVRAPAGRAAEAPVGAPPHHELLVPDVDRSHLAGASSVAGSPLGRIRERAHDPFALVERRTAPSPPDHVAQQRRVRAVARRVRGHARQVEQRVPPRRRRAAARSMPVAASAASGRDPVHGAPLRRRANAFG